MAERLRQALPVLIGIVVFVVALELLRHELHALTWADLTTDIFRTSNTRLALAFLLTALNYVVLTGYDWLAVEYIGKRLPIARVMATSLVAYAISNSVGLGIVSGASVRYRFYSRWGITAADLSRIVLSYSITFWLGLLALGGLSLALTPPPATLDMPAHHLFAPIGIILTASALSYLALPLSGRQMFRIGRHELSLPSERIAVAQLIVSSLDWALAGAVLFVLLPSGHVSYISFLSAFLTAQLVGLASHVPGGAGVFEGLMLLLLAPRASPADLVPALVVYRAVYYLLPLTAALVALVFDEVRQRRDQVARLGAAMGHLSEAVVPRILAVFTFLAGAFLLVSGATPAGSGRLDLLHRLVPVGLIEASHFLGSVVGALLLLLSQGLARRLDAAYYLTIGALATGVVVSLLKGVDYEEATLLGLLLMVLRNVRPAFDRRAALLETRFSPGWIAAIVGALIASVWVGLFAFKHVEYSNDLWWQFELRGQASRFLRGSVGAALVLGFFVFARLIGYARHKAVKPSDDDIQNAGRIIASQTSTLPHLVYLRDKAIMFDQARDAFIMYGVQGRTWVALGDPVGPTDRSPELIRAFLERCDDFGGTPAFYEIRGEYLHHYADFGFTFVKLGEEARVDLTGFTLQGSRGSSYRKLLHRLERTGSTFRVVPQRGVPSIMSELRRVSDEWLRAKAGAEKGFSLGFFDPQYICRFPVAVVERDERVEAFANVWPGAANVELSVDLMRYGRGAPRDVMEALLIHLMDWGQRCGFRSFVLGMAPLSGFETSPIAPLWTRLGSFMYEHGESLYNFQGLRSYKEKFHPRWEPRYLAFQGGLRLPRILADVSVLIAGGYRRILLK